MTHKHLLGWDIGFAGSAKPSRALLAQSRNFFNNGRPFADGDLAVTAELTDGADVIKGSRQWKKSSFVFFRNAAIFGHCLPCTSSIFENYFQIKQNFICDVPDHFPMCFRPRAL